MRTESSVIHARHRRLRVLLTVLAAALFLQACAQDAAPESGGDASAAAEQASTAPAGDGGEAATDAAVTEEDAAADDADGGAAAGEIAGVDLTADFCTINNQLDESSIFDQEPETAEDFSATSEQIKEIYRVLAEKAPQEIADDVNFVTETGTRQIDLANELIREAGGDPAQVLEDPEVAEQMVQLDEEEGFQEAADRLETWTEENC